MKPLARRSVVALLALLWGFPGLAPAQGAPSPSDPPEQEYDLKFSGECGLVTRYASTRVSPACLTEAQNIVLDEDFTWSRRRGQSVYNATTCTDAKSIRGLWPFDSTDGTRYLIIFSSKSFFSSTAGDCSQITSSTFSATAPMSCAQGLGKLVCSNGTDAAVSIDSNLSTATLSGMPRGELVGFFRNRFLTAKIQGALTRIYGSGDGDPTDWTLKIPGRSTSPFTLDIAGTNDGKAVTCLLGEYQNAYFVGRDDELLAIYGNDRRDFTLRKISDQVGCSEPYSVKEKNNALYWISRRGVEKMSGTAITRISDPIRPTIDEILVAAGNSVSVTDTTQADFEAGNLEVSGPGAPMSATISAGSVVGSTWAVTENTATQWAAGTRVNMSTAVPGYLYLRQGSSAAFTNAGGESSDSSTNWNTNSFTNIASGASSCGAIYGTRLWYGSTPSSCAQTLTFQVKNGAGAVFYSSAVVVGATSCQRKTLAIDTSTMPASMGILTVASTNGKSAESVPFIVGTSIGIKYENISGVGDCQFVWDMDESQMVTSGTYVTQTYNTGLSTPTWGPFVASVSSGGMNTALFQTRVKTAAGGFDSAISATNGLRVTSAQKQYVIIESSYTVVKTTNAPPYVSALNLSAATTGYFISQCRNPGTAITSWGLFSCDSGGSGGSLSYSISVGTTCHGVTRATATWEAQTNNTTIEASTATYVAYRTLFNIDSATQTPTLWDCTINWNEGSDRPDVVAEVYRDRYHLYYTTSTASGSYNDHALVLDQNDKWTIFDGVNAASVTTFKNKLYIGDSQATGKIYIQDVGHDDLGEPFTMRFRTADLDFGDPTKPKSFKTLYVMMHSEEEPTQDIPVTFRYRIDGATTTYSLGACNMDEASEVGYFVCKLPFSVDEAVDARWLSVEAEYTGSQGPVRIYGMKFIYSHKERE